MGILVIFLEIWASGTMRRKWCCCLFQFEALCLVLLNVGLFRSMIRGFTWVLPLTACFFQQERLSAENIAQTHILISCAFAFSNTSPFWNYSMLKIVLITDAISPEKFMKRLVCSVLNMNIWQCLVVSLWLNWDFIQCGCTAVVMSAGVTEVSEVMCVCVCVSVSRAAGVKAGGSRRHCVCVLHSHFHA